MKKIQLLIGCGLLAFLISCAGPEKADFASNADAGAAVSEVSSLQERVEQEQADLFAYDEYKQGTKYLQRAKNDLAGNAKKENILENAAIAKASFQNAQNIAKSNSASAARILEARQAVVKAGLRKSVALQEELADVDEDLRDETDNFSEQLNPKKFSEFQKKYFSLEIKAVQFSTLNDTEQAIKKATQNNAEDLAPQSLTTALLDLTEAENEVAQSPRNPDIHMKSVRKSMASAVLLSDVMDVILNAKGTPENIALKIVKQNRELGSLSKKAGQLEENLKSTQSNLTQKEGELKKQGEALKHSSTQVRFQNAMEEARQQFSDDEASVYQQGNKLIFRLKKINFASGKSTVPSASEPLLAKINDIIKSLDAEVVTVQGHTDSVGASALNLKLSTKRATAVAAHLASLRGGYKTEYVGYGESKPIASNETNEGRAINRRVDLVVTAKK